MRHLDDVMLWYIMRQTRFKAHLKLNNLNESSRWWLSSAKAPYLVTWVDWRHFVGRFMGTLVSTEVIFISQERLKWRWWGGLGIDGSFSLPLAKNQNNQRNSPAFVDQDLLNWRLSWVKLLNLHTFTLFKESASLFMKFGTVWKLHLQPPPAYNLYRLQGCHQHAFDARQSRDHDVEGRNSAKPWRFRCLWRVIKWIKWLDHIIFKRQMPYIYIHLLFTMYAIENSHSFGMRPSETLAYR